MGMLPTIPGLSSLNFNSAAVFNNIFYWMGYLVVILIILTVFVAIGYYVTFNIKCTYWPLVGSGNTTEISVGKKKTNRFKWNKTKDGWKAMFPLFNKNSVEPFDPKHIYYGNQTYAFKLGNQWIPGCINISQGETKSIQAEINPVPHYVRNWESVEFKKNAMEYAVKDWWSTNKMWVFALIGVGICCGMCVITIYMSYKFGAGGVQATKSFADAVQGMNLIPGAAAP